MLQLLASDYRLIAQDMMSVIVLIAAFKWGGGPERAVAAAWFVIFKLTSFLRDLIWPSPLQLMDIDVFMASTDAVACIAFVAIALYANRNYTLWIAGLQVLATSAHVARAMIESISPIAYVTMIAAPGWFQLFLIMIGLARHIRRQKQFGTYRDWRLTGYTGSFDAGAKVPATLGNPHESWRNEL